MESKRITCALEEMYKVDGYVVIYDGQQRPPDDGSRQFVSSPGDIRYFTRKLRKAVNGKFVNQYVVFVYDLRDGFCVDVKENPNDPNSRRKRRVRFQERDTEESIEAGGNMRCLLGWVHGIGSLWEKLLCCAG